MIPSVIFNILTASTAVTDIVAHRIYPEYAPQGASMPYVVYEIDGVSPEPNKDTTSRLDNTSFTLVMFDSDYDTLFTLDAACRSALDRYQGTVESSVIDAINYKNTKSGYDNQANVYVLESEYQVREKL